MIVYSEPKDTFVTQAKGGKEIAAIIFRNVFERLGIRASPHGKTPIFSWRQKWS